MKHNAEHWEGKAVEAIEEAAKMPASPRTTMVVGLAQVYATLAVAAASETEELSRQRKAARRLHLLEAAVGGSDWADLEEQIQNDPLAAALVQIGAQRHLDGRRRAARLEGQ